MMAGLCSFSFLTTNFYIREIFLFAQLSLIKFMETYMKTAASKLQSNRAIPLGTWHWYRTNGYSDATHSYKWGKTNKMTVTRNCVSQTIYSTFLAKQYVVIKSEITQNWKPFYLNKPNKTNEKAIHSVSFLNQHLANYTKNSNSLSLTFTDIDSCQCFKNSPPVHSSAELAG